MFDFYARISAPQNAFNAFFSSLAAITRLSRTQIRVFSADAVWNDWGS
jgi:hypothetical protein